MGGLLHPLQHLSNTLIRILTHLEAAAKLLEEAEEEVLADEARELTDKVDAVALAEAA
jgi:hypothetical protein